MERMIVLPTGPRPRLYFIGIAGKRLDPDGEEVKRLFESFRVNECAYRQAPRLFSRLSPVSCPLSPKDGTAGGSP